MGPKQRSCGNEIKSSNEKGSRGFGEANEEKEGKKKRGG